MAEGNRPCLEGLDDNLLLQITRKAGTWATICLALTNNHFYNAVLRTEKVANLNKIGVLGRMRVIVPGNDDPPGEHTMPMALLPLLERLKPWMPKGYFLCKCKAKFLDEKKEVLRVRKLLATETDHKIRCAIVHENTELDCFFRTLIRSHGVWMRPDLMKF